MSGEIDYIDLIARLAEVVGKLATDETRPEDGDALLTRYCIDEVPVVAQVVHRKDTALRAISKRQVQRIRAQGKHQLAVGNRLALKHDLARSRIECVYPQRGTYLALDLRRHLLRGFVYQRFGREALAQRLGERRF